MIKKTILLLLFPFVCFGADHYASPTGSDTWTNSTSISTPCSIETGFANAATGDTLFLRGGVYTISTRLITTNAGSGDADVNRIIVKNYPGEIPTLNATGLENVIIIDDPYWTLDGITINATNVFVGEGNGAGCVHVGYDNSAIYTKIINCTFDIVSLDSFDNSAPIILKGNRSSYAYIYNNTLSGSGGETYASIGGVQFIGIPGATGVKILNNNISDGLYGIMIKHANTDTSLGAAQIKYNYITNTDDYGITGQPTYMTISNNICDGGLFFGDNGGGTQGNNSLIDHNTTYGDNGVLLWSPSEGPIEDCTFTNNIFITKTTFGSTESLNTWNYNMYADDVAIGANDLGNTSPTYTGGATPTNIEGYKLTSESAGYQSGLDSKDFGADTDLVGANITPPSTDGQPVSIGTGEVISLTAGETATVY